jgi:DHA1 family bicyclomycin/chloramphenicol resistance-like MFS transporter
MRIAPASLGFVLLLSGIAVLPPVSIDMCLPALAATGADLAAAPPRVGQMLSLFLLGFAVSQLGCGPVADRDGRRPALLIGCALFCAAGFGAAASRSIGVPLAWRIVPGVGVGAASVMAFAVVRPGGRTARPPVLVASGADT